MSFDFDDLEGDLLEEVDAAVLAQLRAAKPKQISTSRPKLPWLPHGVDGGHACLRLFCFFGAGKQAQDFRAWSELGQTSFPKIHVCPVELPGHALHPGATSADAHAIADRFVIEVLDRLEDDGRPFALFGFSTGARLAYEIARRRPPVRLYVAGRAAPNVRVLAPGEDSPHAILREDPARTMRWATKMWGTAAEQASMERLIKQAELDGDWEMLSIYAKSTLDDLDLGATVLRDIDSNGRELEKTIRCRIFVYEAELDSSWPPSVILNTWDGYQAAGCTIKKTYKGMTHDELCAASGQPLLEAVLTNLVALVEEGMDGSTLDSDNT